MDCCSSRGHLWGLGGVGLLFDTACGGLLEGWL